MRGNYGMTANSVKNRNSWLTKMNYEFTLLTKIKFKCNVKMLIIPLQLCNSILKKTKIKRRKIALVYHTLIYMYIVLVMNVWENQYKVQYIYAKYQHGIAQRKYVNNKTEM